MIALMLAAALTMQQGSGPSVMIATDRDRVSVGEVLGFTIRIWSDHPEPVQADLPNLGGFELAGRTEHSDVTTGPHPGRTTVIQLQLRALRAGEWRLGPVQVRQGSAIALSDPVTVKIDAGAPGPVSASLSPGLARLLQSAQPPGGLDRAGISIAVSGAEVPVGQQVDVITIAWFERGLRQDLRRAPTVESPRIEGVWSYPQPVPGGIAASRNVAGRWYDLFVLHQVVFPLTPGAVQISPARLQYSVPLAYQFFSQEEPFRLESQPASFQVRALPDSGRDPGFRGAVGRDLAITQAVDPGSGRQGEPFAIEITISGQGNVALWPQPDLRWPVGGRVYPEAAAEQLVMREGRLGGQKTFKFLFVADSAGTLTLPGLRYPFYDPVGATYRIAMTPPTAIIVAPRDIRTASRAEPPPLRLDTSWPVAELVRDSLPPWAWWLVLFSPVAGWFALARRPRRRTTVSGARTEADPLAVAERRLRAALRDSALAPPDLTRLRNLLQRVEVARFGAAAAPVPPALLTEVNGLLERQPAGAPGQRWRDRTGLCLLVALLGSTQLGAQTQPEQFYEAGAYRAAMEGFQRRAVLSPEVPNHWFNLGAAAYRAGDDAAALVAWVHAARLAPRDGGIRRALQMVPPSDAATGRELVVSPITPAEFWLIGMVLWFTGWSGLLWTRRVRGRWMVLLIGGVVSVAMGSELGSWYQRPLAVLARNTQLRLSPHGLAPTTAEGARLGAILLLGRRAGWVEGEMLGGGRGWIPVDALEPMNPLPQP